MGRGGAQRTDFEEPSDLPCRLGRREGVMRPISDRGRGAQEGKFSQLRDTRENLLKEERWLIAGLLVLHDLNLQTALS